MERKLSLKNQRVSPLYGWVWKVPWVTFEGVRRLNNNKKVFEILKSLILKYWKTLSHCKWWYIEEYHPSKILSSPIKTDFDKI